MLQKEGDQELVSVQRPGLPHFTCPQTDHESWIVLHETTIQHVTV